MQDVLIEPVRAILIPEFYEMRQTAMAVGALGFGISGSGPSVFAFADNHPTASDITRQIVQHLQSKGIDSNGYVSAVNQQGPREL